MIANVARWKPSNPTLTALVASALGLVLLYLRRPSSLTDPGLYAEDGVIFLLESLRDGITAVSQPYNGYLHLVPRLIAVIAEVLPLAWTPTVFLVCTAAISVASCAILLSERFSTLLPSYASRLLLFALLLVIPRMNEVHLSLNSVLWWCGVALFLTSLADDPSSRPGRIVEMIAIPVLALTGLAAVVLAPLPALRWMRTRSSHSIAILAGWWIASLLQVLVYATQDRENGAVPVGLSLGRAAIEKVFGSLMTGRGAVDSRWVGGVPGIVLLFLAVVAIAWVIVVATSCPWTSSVAIFWTAVMSTAAGFVALGPVAAALPDRYTILPIAAVLTGLVCARPSVKAVSVIRTALLVVIVLMRFTDFIVPARPSTDWSNSVECLEDESRACIVELNPEGWTVTLLPGMR